MLRSGHVRSYVCITVGTALGLVGAAMLARGGIWLEATSLDVRWHELLVGGVISATAIATTLARSRLVAIAFLGVAGYGVAVMFVLIFRRLPEFRTISTRLQRTADAFMSIAAGLVYGSLGTLNMADIALKVRAGEHPEAMTAVSELLMTAFAIKASAFPLFFWLPASYHTPPFADSAIFAGLLTKVGVSAMVRAFTTMFVQDVPFTHGILLVGAGATVVVGVLGAAAQPEFRRVLSFHIVSQIGYMLMGLGAIRLLRMPDVYTRLQAATKTGTLGLGCLMLAIALHFGELGVAVRALLVIAFLFLTAPVAGHAISRTAYLYGTPPWRRTEIDEWSHRSEPNASGRSPSRGSTDS